MNWPAFEEYTPDSATRKQKIPGMELANITKKTAKSGAILSGNDDGVMLTGILHQKGDSAYPSSQRASANNTPSHKKGAETTSGSARDSADGGADTFAGSGGANPFDDDEEDEWD